MASGSIAVVMEGVRNIGGVPEGIYRDGGVTDYHFDIIQLFSLFWEL